MPGRRLLLPLQLGACSQSRGTCLPLACPGLTARSAWFPQPLSLGSSAGSIPLGAEVQQAALWMPRLQGQHREGAGRRAPLTLEDALSSLLERCCGEVLAYQERVGMLGAGSDGSPR